MCSSLQSSQVETRLQFQQTVYIIIDFVASFRPEDNTKPIDANGRQSNGPHRREEPYHSFKQPDMMVSILRITLITSDPT
jgi:hypothetical protein